MEHKIPVLGSARVFPFTSDMSCTPIHVQDTHRLPHHICAPTFAGALQGKMDYIAEGRTEVRRMTGELEA